MTITEAFALAQQYHRAGYFHEAVPIYRQILQADPANAPVLYHLGTACEALRDFPEAVACYQRVLQLDPGRAEVCNQLGVALYWQGKLGEAVAAYERALQLRPDHVEVYNNLGVALEAQGQLERAVACYERFLAARPNRPEVHNNLGVALKNLGKAQEAAAYCRKALELKPDYPEAYLNLCNALRDLGDDKGAEAACRQALQLRPDYPEAYNNLGVALRAQGKFDEAVSCYRKALQLRPQFAEAYGNLGNVFRDMADVDGAASAYRQALAIRPDDVSVHLGLAYVLEEQGWAEEAVRHALEALRVRPDSAPAMITLAELAIHGHYRFPEALWQRIESLVGDPKTPPQDASMLHFALALLREKAGAYDEAFASYRQGNALKRQILIETGRAFDPQDHHEAVDEIIATFTPALFQRLEGFGLDTELPVFVVGMPRSGTSLVEQILARHPAVYGAGELTDVVRLVDALPGRVNAPEGYPRCMDRLDQPTARAMAEDLRQRLARRGRSAGRVIDKAPLNFLHLGLLAVLFPRARVIHCRRDPRDVCLSCYFQYFREVNFSWDLGDLGCYYREYERLMAHWREVLPAQPFDLVYEDLVADQEAVTRRLVAYCGLDWDDRCLTFYESRRPVQTMSKLQVRQPIYTTSVGRWRRYEQHLGPLLEAIQGG